MVSPLILDTFYMLLEWHSFCTLLKMLQKIMWLPDYGRPPYIEASAAVPYASGPLGPRLRGPPQSLTPLRGGLKMRHDESGKERV